MDNATIERISERASRLGKLDTAWTLASEVAQDISMGDIKEASALLEHYNEVAKRVGWLGAKFELVAILQDILKDWNVNTRASLKKPILDLFDDDIFDALIAIGKMTHHGYFSRYLPRVAANPIALQVKIVDLQIKLERLMAQDNPDHDLIQKYTDALGVLGGKIATYYHMEKH
jgi:hypothetical protein